MVVPHTSNGIIPKWKLLFRGAYKWNLVFHLSSLPQALYFLMKLTNFFGKISKVDYE